jgi:hypothetical protein
MVVLVVHGIQCSVEFKQHEQRHPSPVHGTHQVNEHLLNGYLRGMVDVVRRLLKKKQVESGSKGCETFGENTLDELGEMNEKLEIGRWELARYGLNESLLSNGRERA